MLIEIAHFLLILSFVLALIQFTVPLVGSGRGWSNWMRLADKTAFMQFICTFFGFFVLVRAFVASDFTVKLVALNSNSLKKIYLMDFIFFLLV